MVKCKTIFDRYISEVWRLLDDLENAKEYLCRNLKNIIPREWGIYLFKDKLGKAIYIGQSCDKKGGLYTRIIQEHLNPNYHSDIGGSVFIKRLWS